MRAAVPGHPMPTPPKNVTSPGVPAGPCWQHNLEASQGGNPMRFGSALVISAAALFTAGPSFAYDQLVEKQSFTIAAFTTQGGATIRDMRLGWEAYGTLNAAKDNVILVAHYFSGSSHAAGRYAAEDKAAGYWDSIIGAGRPVDTDKYYVISVDTPVNLGAHDPTVITTGPASTDPATGKPYGLTFPILTMRDFAETQKALLDQLGIERLH